MKSLHKILDVLEYVTLQNGLAVTPSEVSSALTLSLATGTRILSELASRGYLVQLSRKTGYVPGPMLASLTTRSNSYSRLADASRLPIANLSSQLGVQVNLAVLNENRRIMLTFHLPNATLNPWDHFFFTDQWNTATGRLLIAAQDDTQARKLIKQQGISPYPKEIISQIRQTGSVRFDYDGLVIIGHWIKVPGLPTAAFGFGVPKDQEDHALRLSLETAQAIKATLHHPNRPY